MYRNTFVEVDLDAIAWNVQHFIRAYSSYQYYFGVVKSDCYGHYGNEVVKTIVNAGCNYLCTATLEEALEIRKELKEIPILCLGIVPIFSAPICIDSNITITVSNWEYLQKLLRKNVSGLKIHLKLNTGMNRLGFKSSEKIQEAFHAIQHSSLFLEGIYSHFYDALEMQTNEQQLQNFSKLTAGIDLKKIPIVHVSASDATIQISKPDVVNGCRLGIVMYGLQDSLEFQAKSTFSLYSEVIQINELQKGEVLGYGGKYLASDSEKIAVMPIGYGDGVLRKNTGRMVYIHDRAYPIVGNICMDMLFVKVDQKVKVGDKVAILRDNQHIREVANYLETIPYEILCTISKRVPRFYKGKSAN